MEPDKGHRGQSFHFTIINFYHVQCVQAKVRINFDASQSVLNFNRHGECSLMSNVYHCSLAVNNVARDGCKATMDCQSP